jgi:hypothetical protein
LVLPGGISVTQTHLAIAAAVLIPFLWILASWSALLLTANLAYAAYRYLWRPRGAVAVGGVVPGGGGGRRRGVWRVTLVKAEIVTDEPWSGTPSLQPNLYSNT